MRGGREERIEKLFDRVAAAIFGAAVAAVVAILFRGSVPLPRLAIVSATGGLVACLVTAGLLRSVRPEPQRFRVPSFAPPELDFDDCDELLLTQQVELLLTEADVLKPAKSSEEELVLDDILAKLGENSRVVRLFDPAATPTPGQLNARIEHHLRQGSAPTAPEDASQALFDALTQLRASLR
jgi:hypothetical protein